MKERKTERKFSYHKKDSYWIYSGSSQVEKWERSTECTTLALSLAVAGTLREIQLPDFATAKCSFAIADRFEAVNGILQLQTDLRLWTVFCSCRHRFEAVNGILQLQTDLRLWTCILRRQLYFNSCQNGRQFCSDKIDCAATKLLLVLAVAKLTGSCSCNNDPRVNAAFW